MLHVREPAHYKHVQKRGFDNVPKIHNPGLGQSNLFHQPNQQAVPERLPKPAPLFLLHLQDKLPAAPHPPVRAVPKMPSPIALAIPLINPPHNPLNPPRMPPLLNLTVDRPLNGPDLRTLM